MQRITTLTNINNKPEYIYVIYSTEGCYLKECKNLVEVAKYFKTSKQALSNHLRRSGQDKSNFVYKGFTIEFFDINEDF